jgi:NtrC-family two-component system response regulator AlgB
MGSILIVADEKSVRTDLAAYLRGRGHVVEAVADTTETLPAMARQDFDVVLIDIEAEGFPLLRQILRQQPDAAVALTAGQASVGEAVQAMRAGAYDYLGRPLSARQVELLVRRAAAARCAARDDQPAHAEDHLAHVTDPPPLLESADPRMARAIAVAQQVAASDAPVLLCGESGTGKRVLAAAIHRWSPRRAGPFVTVWSRAVTDQQVEGGLLEHLAGAVTGARQRKAARPDTVDGGTLFFDEVHALPLAFQGRLLRYLEGQQSGGDAFEEDARIIASTDHDLEADARTGRLRQDLFFHLNVITITLPPLRERRDDLPPLTEHLLAKLAARHQRGPLELTPEAESVLAGHTWPGNVRELLSALERAVVVARGGRIRAEDLNLGGWSAPPPPEATAALSLQEIEQRHIRTVLKESATIGEAAARLGIDPATLWRKRKRYGLAWPRNGNSAAK